MSISESKIDDADNGPDRRRKRAGRPPNKKTSETIPDERICVARAKLTDERCGQAVQPGSKFCYMHGGAEAAGVGHEIDLPPLLAGRYSKDLPPRLLKRYQ